METEFQVERGSFATARDTRDPFPSGDPIRPEGSGRFLPEFQQLLGSDSEPDALFFVESWTLGMPQAVENARQRKMGRADREEQRRMLHKSADLGSRFYVEEVLRAQQFHSSLTSNSSSLPHAWITGKPYGADLDESADWPVGWDDNWDTTLPMTDDLACRILGVSAKSTPGEIKAGYRRMVNRWHPDKFGCRTEEERQAATRKMTAINEAHRVLCSGLRKSAA
jgi:DnaJ-domain-containing protein 1